MYELSEFDAIIRIGAALAAGAALGVERELREKPAGLRTYALVCEGAAIFMVGSILLGKLVLEAGGQQYDPSRIGSTIVQGIGFLAAGVILASGTKVINLTTAAEIWVTAAIGLLIGAGFFVVAFTATIGTIVFVTVFKWIEDRLSPGKSSDRTSLDVNDLS